MQSEICNLISDFQRNSEHFLDMFKTKKRYHGASCVFCSQSEDISKHFQTKKITRNNLLEHRFPLTTDLKLSKTLIRNKSFHLRQNIGRKLKSIFSERLCFTETRILSVTMFDSQGSPTKKNMLKHLDWLRSNNKSGDIIVFYFVGPGFFQNSMQVLVPYDAAREGCISAHYFQQKFLACIPSGVDVNVIFDCGHNGISLPNRYRSRNYSTSVFQNTVPGLKANVCALTSTNEPSKIGLLSLSLINLLISKNLRVTLPQLLHELTARLVKHNVRPQLSLTKTEFFNNSYFCLPKK
jgi:hypothetical protein